MPDFNDRENAPLTEEEIELLKQAAQEAETEADAPAWYEANDAAEEEAETEAEEKAAGTEPRADERDEPQPTAEEDAAAVYALIPKTERETEYKKKRIYQLNSRSTLDLAKKIRSAKGNAVETPIKTYHEVNGQMVENTDGLELNGITVFSARTGGGKTMALVSFAAYLVTMGNQEREGAEHVAVIFSLEEPFDSIYSRALTAYGAYKGQIENGKSTKAAPIVPTSKEVYREVAEMYIPNRADGTSYSTIKWTIEKNAEEMEDYITIVSADMLLTKAMQHGATGAGVYINTLQDLIIGIKAYRELFEAQGKQPLFFIDYAQLIQNGDSNAAIYKQIQSVMHSLMVQAQLGTKIFIGAQSNRNAAGVGMSETKERKERKSSPIYAEVYRAISENMRESADIEQTADTIFYMALDKEHGEAIQQTLKHRSYQEKGIAVFKIIPNTNTIDYSAPLQPREMRDGTTVDRQRGKKQAAAKPQGEESDPAIAAYMNTSNKTGKGRAANAK